MYFRRPPHPLLARHINYYWHVSDTPRQEAVHVVPSGTLEIVFNLRENGIRIGDASDSTRVMAFAGAVVSGAQARYFVTDVQAHASLVGVHFKPGGAFALLGVPPGSLCDGHANLDAIWGPRAGELRERVCAAGSAKERFRILDGVFLQRLSGAVWLRDEVQFALRRLIVPNARVEGVAADVELSHRRFIEIFSAQVGVTPKVFSRVGRFQRTWNLAKEGVARDWAELALTCGYSDQSHLIREFVLLSGHSPMELLQHNAAGHHAALAG
jgi:AraC-like DNA-binding protein